MLINRQHEKFLQAILYFAHNTHYLGKVKLFKLLYLLDFEHFRQTGRSVTGLEYRAWKMGPVPSQLVQQWDEMEEDLGQAIKIVPERVIEYWREKVVPLQPFDPDAFTRRELHIMDTVASRYCDAMSAEMIDVTHAQNGAWATVWAEGRGSNAVIPYELSLSANDPNREAVLEAAQEYRALAAE